MDVRLARPTDAPLALTLALDEGAHLVRCLEWPAKKGVLRTAMRAALPLALPGRTWIGKGLGTAALLEATPRRYVIGWDVTRLVVRGDRGLILGPILEAAMEHLRSKGVPRLFARCQDDAAEELKTVAFHPLAREIVLVGPSAPAGGDTTLPEDSRYRMPQDAWPLHQLESEVTPPLVRHMEGLSSQDWSRKVKEMSEIVVERDGKVVAWVGWGQRLSNNLYLLNILIHPQCREMAEPLLFHVMQNTVPGRQYLVRVREYQSEIVQAFLEAGFQVVAEEILMIKHARVELAKEGKRVIQVAQVPTAHIFNQRRRAARRRILHEANDRYYNEVGP